MKLLLDLGNTRLKWQLYEDENNSVSGACVHADALQQVELWCALPIEGVWLASVGQSALAEQLLGQLRGYGFAVHQLSSLAQQAGVTNAYTEPAKLGVDRWLALLAARRHLKAAALLVDAGTAMTLDVLDAEGMHQGGLIVPGLHMMRGSLHSNTALLPEAKGHSTCLGINTQQAITAGTLGALLGVLESTYTRQAELYPDLLCVITGGDAELVYNALPVVLRKRCKVDADWLFKGLLVAAESAA